ncbi:MAG: hypothetical protein WDA20_04820 [Desulfuromonadales bacterium]
MSELLHETRECTRLRRPAVGVPFLVFLLLALASPALSAPAISCHCFQDRSFDPAEPHKVEPYLLATTRNSFLAVAYGRSKKEIVRLRMSGTAGEDLWVAYYLAEKTGTPAAEWFEARRQAGSWLSTVTARGIGPERTGALFGRALTTRGTDQTLAVAAADETLSATLRVSPADLQGFRKKGADTGEIILALLLARRLDRPGAEIFAEVKGSLTTWGGLVDAVGIRPGEMEAAVRSLLR